MNRILLFSAFVLISLASVAQNTNGRINQHYDDGYGNGYGNGGYYDNGYSNNDVINGRRNNYNDPRNIIVPELTVVEVGGEARVFYPSFLRELRPTSLRVESNDYVFATTQTNEYFKIKGRKSGRNIQIICRYRWTSSNGGQTQSHDDVYVFYANVVRVDPEEVHIPKEINIGWGNGEYLKPKLYPENAETRLTFETSDPQVVTVGSSGYLTGVSLGEATVTVTTSNGISTSTDVTVVIPECEKVSFDATSHTLEYVGDKAQLVAKFKPEHADPIFSWESSDPDVIKIDDDGNAEAVGEGKCAIWLRSDNGKQYYKNFKIKAAKK